MDFSDLFLQEEFSDAVLVLKAPTRKRGRDEQAAGEQQQDPAQQELQVLRTIPAHSTILSRSPVLKAAMQCWQQEEEGEQQQTQQEPAATAGPASKRRLVATVALESAQQEPVAMALLAAMYQGPTALKDARVTDVLLLQVLLLADMLGVLQVAKQAVEEIRSRAADTPMSAQLQDALLQLPAWPDCLKCVFDTLAERSVADGAISMPNLARTWLIVDGLQPDSTLEAAKAAENAGSMGGALRSRFARLQKAWAINKLWHEMLRLPLVAMQLLLDSDDLEVACEDDVFTAHRYIAHRRTPELQRLAQQRLAPLVRVPYLSHRWILEQLTAGAPQHLVLSSVLSQIHLWVSLLEVNGGLETPGMPSSWSRSARKSAEPVSQISLLCTMRVADIKRTSYRAFEQRPRSAVLTGPFSAPLAGVGFTPFLLFRATDAGTTLSFLCEQVASSSQAHTLVFIDISFTLILGPVSRSGTAVSAIRGPIAEDGGVGWAGFHDFLQIGPMAGGWDELAWANKGLPAAGEVEVRLKVSLVNQENPAPAPAVAGDEAE